ncbi:MAG: hypothetical protein L3J41_05750 [Melioribacteraceae bacterium]|nr:hypothetical protein [Melioribacteraceae bacterium]
MEDILPKIYIGISELSKNFINNFETLVKKEKNFTYNIDKNINRNNNYFIINVIPDNNLGHIGLFGQLISRSKEKNKIIVEIRANKWNSEPTNYNEYVAAAKSIFNDLLKNYNKTNQKRYRLNIQKRKDTEPKLPPGAKIIFDVFINSANKQILHPLDWRRFYFFVKYCHSKKVKIYQEDIMRLLIAENFSEEKAEYLADIFHHGIEILKNT